MHLQSSSPFEGYVHNSTCSVSQLLRLSTVAQDLSSKDPKTRPFFAIFNHLFPSFPSGCSATPANQIGRQVLCWSNRMPGVWCMVDGGWMGGQLRWPFTPFRPFVAFFVPFVLFVGQSPDKQTNKQTHTASVWNRCLGYMLSMKWLNGENTQKPS